MSYKLTPDIKLRLSGIYGGYTTSGMSPSNFNTVENSQEMAWNGLPQVTDPYQWNKYALSGSWCSWPELRRLGNFSLAIAAIGSALGTGVAGMAAIGAWKKAFAQNKAAPFILVAFVGAPLTQTIYGMILRNAIQTANLPPESYTHQMILGFITGLAMGMSAYMQGKAGAKASDALAETGKGFGNYIMVLGVIETVALFVMVFCMTALPKA